MPGELDYTLQEQDLVDGNRLHARQLWNKRTVIRTWLCISIIAIVGCFFAWDADVWDFVWIAIAFAAYMAIGSHVGKAIFSRFARRSYRQAKAFWRQTKFSWTDDSLEFKSARGQGRSEWSDFYSWAADEKSVLLYQTANTFITVPVGSIDAVLREEIVTNLRNAGVVERSLIRSERFNFRESRRQKSETAD